MRVDAINPGTTRNPPPIPKNPDSRSVIPPDANSLGALPRSRTTLASPSAERPRNMSTATTSISKANKASSFWPSNDLPSVDPK